MSILNYGKKLLKDGVLIAKPLLLHAHDEHEIWTPDFTESIIFVKASKQNYQSSLHFFWQTLFHQREVQNEQEALEVFSETHLHKTTLEQAKSIINKTCPLWFKQHSSVLPDARWTHIIWQEANDICIIFEDDVQYYVWNWDKSAFF